MCIYKATLGHSFLSYKRYQFTKKMLFNQGPHHGNKFITQARPFDEFLIINPTGNTSNIIYSSVSPEYPLQQQQPYVQQRYFSQRNLSQTTFQTTTQPYPTVSPK